MLSYLGVILGGAILGTRLGNRHLAYRKPEDKILGRLGLNPVEELEALWFVWEVVRISSPLLFETWGNPCYLEPRLSKGQKIRLSKKSCEPYGLVVLTYAISKEYPSPFYHPVICPFCLPALYVLRFTRSIWWTRVR